MTPPTSDSPASSNAIAWVQIRLLGGGQRIAAVAAFYAALLVFISVLFYRIARNEISAATFAGYALSALTFLEAALLLFVGSGVIRKAVHRDFTSDMMTSHRSTALSGYSVVIGYLTGATAQIWALTLVNWIASTIFASIAGYQTTIYAPTVVLFLLCTLTLLAWTCGVLVGLNSRGGMAIVPILVISIVLWNVGLISVLPGLALLVGYTTLQNLPSAAATGLPDETAIISILGQLCLSAIFFVAAARKYARDDVPAFTPPLATLLLIVWTVLSGLGLFYATTSPRSFVDRIVDSHIRMVATLVLLTLIGFLPIASGARQWAMWEARRMRDPECTMRRPRRTFEWAVLVTLIVGLLVVITQQALRPVAESAAIVAAVLFAGLTTGGLFRVAYKRMPKAVWIGALYVFFFWFVPIMLDIGLSVLMDRRQGEACYPVFGCSPVGTWILVLTPLEGPVWIGLAFQGLVAAAALMVGLRKNRRVVRSTAEIGDRTPPMILPVSLAPEQVSGASISDQPK